MRTRPLLRKIGAAFRATFVLPPRPINLARAVACELGLAFIVAPVVAFGVGARSPIQIWAECAYVIAGALLLRIWLEVAS